MLFLEVVMAVAASASVVAPAEAAPGDERSSGLRGELGVGSPTGVLGASVWRDLTPPLRLEGGIGIGLSGLQLSALGRFILGGRNHRFVPALGLSVGVPVGGSNFRDVHDGNAVIMPWLNADVLGYEYVSNGGWTTLVALGVTLPLRSAHWDFAYSGGSVRPFQTWYPEAHVAFGKAF